jgi:hypothetical protein
LATFIIAVFFPESFPQQAHQRRCHDVHQGQRQQELPTEGDELVVAQAGQAGAQPEEQQHDRQGLEREPGHCHPGLEGSVPATQVQDGGEHRDQQYTEVLAQEEQTEAHAAVFRIEAGGQLVLRLGKVEGQPMGLRHAAREEDQEPHGLQQQIRNLLSIHDLRQAEGAGQQHHAHHRQPQGQLIADHLRDGPHRADQGELAVRCPAAQKHAVGVDGAHGQHEQQTDVEIADPADSGADRDYNEAYQHRAGDQDRRQGVEEPLGERRHECLLGQ